MQGTSFLVDPFAPTASWKLQSSEHRRYSAIVDSIWRPTHTRLVQDFREPRRIPIAWNVVYEPMHTQHFPDLTRSHPLAFKIINDSLTKTSISSIKADTSLFDKNVRSQDDV